ncbi:MAG TPA: CHAD domain-containing protein [Leptolyngbyaceae cyanobacterium M33_DOE_097]|uniref:CHAD domain-containing protein n=1 Tax=Oscillatoriales cyanobacterium SpSt-418 TaxID=2282169 RepID=A0A7C3PHK4_9CYAN|nr:CHAD domain-containing protein [Leptolyngbyaceae cyanobacterium M33_DOE_097]
MAQTQQGNASDLATHSPQSLEAYTYQVIEEQYCRIVKQEKKVLADKDPEALHQMRVGTRRLRTALQVFGSAIDLPKAGSAQRLRNLARVLGKVRDLDVQLASLEQEYRPNLNKKEQKQLDTVSETLKKQRLKAFARMKAVLSQPLYQELKTTYAHWLQRPCYTPIAQLPLSVLLPDLLGPLLSHLLLHPGWLISSKEAAGENGVMLHELRKACKHVRYQAEFFTPFYGKAFEDWVVEIKELQAQLGDFQDTQVFLELATKILGRELHLPELQATIEQKRRGALVNWEEIRQKYLDEGFRYHLHRMLLQPTVKAGQVHPELVG